MRQNVSVQLEGFDPGDIGEFGVFVGTPPLLILGDGGGTLGPVAAGVDGTG